MTRCPRGYRQCRRCGDQKPTIGNFKRHANGRYSGICNDCRGLEIVPNGYDKEARRRAQPMGIPLECDDWLRYKLAAPIRAVRVIE